MDWQMAANRSRIVARLSGSALAVLKLACARWWATRQALQGRAAVRARGRGSTSAGPNASCDESARRVGGRRCRGRDSRRRGAGTAPRTPPAIRRAGRRARPSLRGTTQPNFGQPNPTSDNPTQPQPNPTRNNPTQSTILLLGPHGVEPPPCRRRSDADCSGAPLPEASRVLLPQRLQLRVAAAGPRLAQSRQPLHERAVEALETSALNQSRRSSCKSVFVGTSLTARSSVKRMMLAHVLCELTITALAIMTQT